MFDHCVFCHHPFESNESLEHFPVGRRIAYDPQRGRLWATCRMCGRWSLAPIEERWEALEELDRLTTDRARLLSQTEHIALLRAEDLEIVRVGKAQLREEAWWRYGREILRRRDRSKKLHYVQIGLMVVAQGALAFAGGFAGIGGMYGHNYLSDIDRWRRYGRTAWKGALVCPACGDVLDRLRFREAKQLQVVTGPDDDMALRMKCRVCGSRHSEEGGYYFTGVSADHVLRRVLAYRNYAGGKEKHVKEATSYIEEAGSPTALARQLAHNGFQLKESSRRKNPMLSLALEIAVNDDTERRMLELELEALEARWREEEEIAAISDGELTPIPKLNEFLTRVGLASAPLGGTHRALLPGTGDATSGA